MRCFECDKGKLIAQVAEVAGEVRGEKYTIRTEAMVCNHCGAQTLTETQSAAYSLAIADAYRTKQGLLTSRELKQIRARLGLSLRGFARFVGVGLASVKRWQAGAIQDETHDRLIRLRTDLEAARRNLRELERQLGLASTGQPQVTEVSFRLRRPEVPEWAAESPSIADVTIAPGFLHGFCPSA